MSITRVEAEQILDRRIGAFLAEADMIVDSGVNPWLTDPLRWALAALDAAPAAYTSVTDDDLAAIDAARVDALLDLTELKALESVQTNLTAVDVTAGPLQERRSQLADRLAEMVREKRKICAARYTQWLSTPLTDDAPKRAALRVL